MTILEQSLVFIGSSIASGITWDVLKTSGSNIIKNFKEKFLKKNVFENEGQCDEFLERISSNPSNSIKKPFNDVQTIFEDITDNETVNFSEEFQLWLKENEEKLKDLVSNPMQMASVHIGSQTNLGSGNIINTGIWNGNIGR